MGTALSGAVYAHVGAIVPNGMATVDGSRSARLGLGDKRTSHSIKE